MTTSASKEKWLPFGLALVAIGIWGYNLLQIVGVVQQPIVLEEVAVAPINPVPEPRLHTPAPPYIADFHDPFHPPKAPSRPMLEASTHRATPVATYTLLAIVGKTAILEDSTGTAHVATSGETLGPYTLLVPTANVVRLTAGRDTETLYLTD
jgi:hypothetical protein